MADDATDTTTQTTTEGATTAPADVTSTAAAGAVASDPPAETTILGGDAPGADAGKEGKDGADGTGDDKGAVETAAPEKYDLTAPEGMAFDAEAFAAAEPVFRELGLSNENAQKLMGPAGEFAKRVGASAVEQHLAGTAQEFTATKAQWAKDAQADEELGGAKWADTRNLGQKALNALGFGEGTPFRTFLDETGLGNHPEMIRAMRRVGERVSEDSFVAAETIAVKKTGGQALYADAFQPR